MNNKKSRAHQPDREEEKFAKEKKPPESAKAPTLEDLQKITTDISPVIQRIYEQMDPTGLERRQILEQIQDLVAKELENAAGEEQAELESFQKRIESELANELEKTETKIDSTLVKRTARDVEFSARVEAFAAGQESEENRKELAGRLGRQNWTKVFNELQAGDRVLSFLVPGADFLSIKYLNDKVVGPQITNEIIEQKRRVIEDEMKKVLHKDAEFIQNDYKVEVIKIPKDAEITTEQLEAMAKAVDDAMTEFVKGLVDGLLAKEKDEKKIEVLNDFRDNLQGKSGKKGFKMNYGLSEPVAGDTAKDKLSSLTQSLQTSRMARESKNYGTEYNKDKVLAELEGIKDLREEIIGGGNKITDKDGNEFTLFAKEGNKWALNRDVLRDVRKGKFEVQNGNKKALDAVSLYLKKLNLLDVVKPFTFAELKKTEQDAEINKDLAEKIESGTLNEIERARAVKALRAEEKDANYTSKSEFHKRATAMDNAAYISLDVLDLGVDLLLEYESALQEADGLAGDEKMEKFNELSLKAGDETTEELRKFREKVADVCEKIGLKKDLIVAEVGGDELTLVIDTNEVHENDLQKLLFELKRATNTRVIKTVVAETEKKISPDTNDRGKIEEHLKALKRAEKGTSIAKDIEDAERKLSRLLKTQGKAAVEEKIKFLPGLFVFEKAKNGEIKVKANVIVLEKDNEFKIANQSKENEEVYESLGYEFNYDEIKNQLNSILGKVEKEEEPAEVEVNTSKKSATG